MTIPSRFSKIISSQVSELGSCELIIESRWMGKDEECWLFNSCKTVLVPKEASRGRKLLLQSEESSSFNLALK